METKFCEKCGEKLSKWAHTCRQYYIDITKCDNPTIDIEPTYIGWGVSAYAAAENVLKSLNEASEDGFMKEFDAKIRVKALVNGAKNYFLVKVETNTEYNAEDITDEDVWVTSAKPAANEAATTAAPAKTEPGKVFSTQHEAGCTSKRCTPLPGTQSHSHKASSPEWTTSAEQNSGWGGSWGADAGAGFGFQEDDTDFYGYPVGGYRR